MTERERPNTGSNQGNPELTRRVVNPTLNSGDIFMAGDQGQENAPASQGEGQVANGDISRRDASTRVNVGPHGPESVQVPLSDLNARLSEIMALFGDQGFADIRQRLLAAQKKGHRQFSR